MAPVHVLGASREGKAQGDRLRRPACLGAGDPRRPACSGPGDRLVVLLRCSGSGIL
jgi:hypothetical protein